MWDGRRRPSVKDALHDLELSWFGNGRDGLSEGDDMATIAHQNISFAQRRRDEQLEGRLLFALGFIVFLIAAIVSRLLPWTGRSQQRRQSIIDQARTDARTMIPFVFMG